MDKQTKPVQGGVPELAAMALPMVASLACDTVMTFTDRLFLSKLSPEHMNAALGGGLACFLSITFFGGLIGYTTALVAQQYGAGRKGRASVAATQAMIVALLAWPLLLLLRPLAPHVFAAEGINPEQVRLQSQYFGILILGAGLGLLRNALGGFFCGIGRTTVVMASNLTAMAVNALAAWVLIFGHWGFPALGIVGAGIGTLIGGAAGLAVMAVAYLRPANRAEYGVDAAWRFDRPLMGELLRFGSPSGVEMLLNMLAFNMIVMLFHQHSPTTATAASILFNYDMISFVPMIGIEIGVTSLVGRYVGARRPAAVRRVVASGVKITLGYCVAVSAALLAVPHLLAGVFAPPVPDPAFAASAALAAQMLRLAAIYMLVQGAWLTLAGALRGSGDTLWLMGLTVALHWSMLAGLWVALKVAHAPAIGGWLVVVLAFAPFPLVLWARWRRGRWRRALRPGGVPETAESFPPVVDL